MPSGWTQQGNVSDARAWPLLFAAWVVALVSTLGALFIGEVMGQAPCVLCWFQRAFMFPLAVILAVACYRSDAGIWRYALPVAAHVAERLEVALAGGALDADGQRHRALEGAHDLDGGDLLRPPRETEDEGARVVQGSTRYALLRWSRPGTSCMGCWVVP